MIISRLAAVFAVVLLLAACQSSSKPPAPVEAPEKAAEKPEGEHANPPYASVRDMMRAKLAHAQAALEAVTQNEFTQLEANANALLHLSTLTDWQVHRTMEYNQYSEEFRWNAKEMARHAREKKLHAATIDYTSLTLTCVKCHDYMKQAGLVKFDLSETLAGRGK